MPAPSLRRGLPRRPGGAPWPSAAALQESEVDAAPGAEAAPGVEAGEVLGADSAAALRAGLPRVAGGPPWPPEGEVAGAARSVERTPVEQDPMPAREAEEDRSPVQELETAGRHVRRGLPRVAGGDGWPPAGTMLDEQAVDWTQAPIGGTAANDAGADAVVGPDPADRDAAAAPAAMSASASETRETAPAVGTVDEPSAAAHDRPRFSVPGWVRLGVLGTLGLLVVCAVAVLLTRLLLRQAFMHDFMTAFPGEYELPQSAPIGIPAWIGWQHFFNAFLMVLIVRSGMQVRREQRPAAYWTGRSERSTKISLTLWFHQALDILWLVNGVIFVIVLFATGHWVRIVPTSWEVLPNALSAALQYVSLDWPTENGWVSYNALQQLAYFVTVFIAAPIAALSGFRMSGLWPKRAATLSRIYPIELARSLHFPTMLYFVVFIVTHVTLVLATGALRNLNHMYAARGSEDPLLLASDWTGFWLFFASVVVMVAAWFAARPMTLIPIARLFGVVTAR